MDGTDIPGCEELVFSTDDLAPGNPYMPEYVLVQDDVPDGKPNYILLESGNWVLDCGWWTED